MFSVIWFMSLYFVMVNLFICSKSLYSSAVVSSSLSKRLSRILSKTFDNKNQHFHGYTYPVIQSEVEENITEASWFNWGSWGSSASKLEVDVDRVGPRLGDVSGWQSAFLLFSPFEAIFWNSENWKHTFLSICYLEQQTILYWSNPIFFVQYLSSSLNLK